MLLHLLQNIWLVTKPVTNTKLQTINKLFNNYVNNLKKCYVKQHNVVQILKIRDCFILTTNHYNYKNKNYFLKFKMIYNDINVYKLYNGVIRRYLFIISHNYKENENKSEFIKDIVLIIYNKQTKEETIKTINIIEKISFFDTYDEIDKQIKLIFKYDKYQNIRKLNKNNGYNSIMNNIFKRLSCKWFNLNKKGYIKIKSNECECIDNLQYKFKDLINNEIKFPFYINLNMTDLTIKKNKIYYNLFD